MRVKKRGGMVSSTLEGVWVLLVAAVAVCAASNEQPLQQLHALPWRSAMAQKMHTNGRLYGAVKGAGVHEHIRALDDERIHRLSAKHEQLIRAGTRSNQNSGTAATNVAAEQPIHNMLPST